MLRKIGFLILFLSIAVSIMSCRSAETSQNSGSGNSQTNSQPTPSNSSLSVATPCPTPSPDANRKITINAPCDGAKVKPRHFVEGVVSEPNAQVWVIIHPMENADFWAQPSVTVREGGKWKVLCYFGESGQHSGKLYEVMAIANPKGSLREGQLFNGWPEAQSKSQVIEVIRE
jgi:hypothetical protein